MTAPRPSSPRIRPIDLDDVTDPELAETLAGALTLDGRPLNIFGALGHHPKLLKRFNLLGGFLLNKGLIPQRERELVILRIGWNARAVYEFGQHTVIGLRCGLTQDEIAALTQAPDTTWAALAARWNDAELVELLVVAGFYRLVSGFLNSAGVQLDPGVPGFP
jgi:4-carboxymuconolactone decarboxylase